MDINHHFDLNLCSHGVKIEVKQVDDNSIWHFTAFNLKAAAVTRQLIPKISHTQEHCVSFVWRHGQ